jgi:DNA mismatch repair ATPase MutL
MVQGKWTSLLLPLLPTTSCLLLSLPAKTLTSVVPSCPSDLKHIIRSNNDRCFFFVNNRPINPLQIITRPINVAFRRHFTLPTGRFPFLFISLTVPTDQCDVNLTPEKRSVKLRGEDFYYETILDLLNEVYPLPVLEQTSTRSEETGGTRQGGGEKEEDDDVATQLYPNQDGQRSSPSPSADSNGSGSAGNRYIYRASPAALEQAAKWLPTAQNSKGRDITVPSPFAGLVTPGRPPLSTSTFSSSSSSSSAFPNRSTNALRRDDDFADDDLLDLGGNSSPSPKSPTSILPIRYGSSPSSSSSPCRSSHSLPGSSTSSSTYWSSASSTSPTSRSSYSSSPTSYSTPLTPSSSERKRQREREFEDDYAVDFDEESTSTDFVRASQQNNQPRNPNLLNLPTSSPSSGLQTLKKFSPQKPIPQYLSRSEDGKSALLFYL